MESETNAVDQAESAAEGDRETEQALGAAWPRDETASRGRHKKFSEARRRLS